MTFYIRRDMMALSDCNNSQINLEGGTVSVKKEPSETTSLEDLQTQVDLLQAQMKEQQNTLEQLQLEIHKKKLETTTNNLKNMNLDKEKRVKQLERSFLTHWSHFFFSECSMISKNMGKCEKTIADLKVVSEHLTQTSTPTRDECLENIAKWENQYKIESDYLQSLTQQYNSAINALQNEEDVVPYVNHPRPADINNLQDILHDSFLYTYKSLLSAQDSLKVPLPNACERLISNVYSDQGDNGVINKSSFGMGGNAQNDLAIVSRLEYQMVPVKLESTHCDPYKQLAVNVFDKRLQNSIGTQTGEAGDVSDREDLPFPLRHKPDVSNMPMELQNKFKFRSPSFVVKSVYKCHFVQMFNFIKQNIAGVTDEEILFVLRTAKEKNKYLSSASQEKILTAVLMEFDKVKGCYSDFRKNVEQICVICFHPFGEESKTRLRCKHSYHTTCITTHFQSDCPLCMLSAPGY
uniref:RING-type domain-containing protein n=2 Tax=Photinus pyralis TaxID=7054 RepID=A0A1Y1L239_PHOPY